MADYFLLNSAKFWGGGEQWFLQCADQLAGRGHCVTVAGRAGGIFLDRMAKAGLTILPLRLSSDFDVSDIVTLRRWLTANRPAAILGNFTRDVRLAGIARRFTRDDNSRLVWVMGSILLKNTYRHRRLVTRSVDRIIVPSVSLKDELLAFPYVDPETVAVLPIGLDLDGWPVPSDQEIHEARTKIQLAEDRLVLGVFARLESRKGQRILLEAWPSIHKACPRSSLRIYGTGADEENLRRYARQNNLEDVEFAGFVENVRDAICACDLIVQPSLYEPFGITLLEAMACGKAVVCTRVGGMPEVVAENETALIIPPDDPDALAEAIGRILSDTNLRQQLGQAGRQRVETYFNLLTMIDRLERQLTDWPSTPKING